MVKSVEVQLKSWEEYTEEEKKALFNSLRGLRKGSREKSKERDNRQRRWLRAQRNTLDPFIKRDFGTFCPICGFKNVYLLREVRKCKGCGMEFILLGNRFDFVKIKEEK